MHRHTYAKNAAILTATGFALRAVGMFFRIYIAALIGAGGMGLFQLIATVYMLAITFSSAGLQVVATRITSEQLVKNKNGLRHALNSVLSLGFILGTLGCAVLFFTSPLIATHLLHNEGAALPLKILAPSLPFMALSSVFRGYFLAVKKVGPNVISQIFEQTVRLIIVFGLLHILGNAPVATSVAAIVVGNTISEALSWAYMSISYKKAVSTLQKGKSNYSTGTITKLLAPIAASQYSTGTLKTIENLIVPICLAMYIGNMDVAIEQFGALKGMAMPVLFFPFSFIGTLATLLLPDISAAYVQNKSEVLKRLVARVMILTIGVSVMAGGMFTLFANEIAQILYKSEEIGFYLQILGPLAPFMYLESMVDGILKGLNEQVATFRYTIFDCAIRIALIYALLPHFGIMGFLYVMIVSNLFTCTFNLRRLLKVTGIKFNIRAWLIGPALAAVAAGAIWQIVTYLHIFEVDNIILQTSIGCVLFMVFYSLLMPKLSGLSISNIISK